MASLTTRLKRESLEQELAARKKDYQAVDRKYRREIRPAEKNSLRAELDELLEDIERIEQETRKLISDEEKQLEKKLITILQANYSFHISEIYKAYKLSLPKNLIKIEFPQRAESLIGNLLLPIPQDEDSSYLEKFLGNLLLILDESSDLKQKLKELVEEYIVDCICLMNQLRCNLTIIEQQCIPGLLVVVSELESNYIIEAWFIKNLEQYSTSNKVTNNCDHLELVEPTTEDSRTEKSHKFIKTDTKLSNLPKTIKELIIKLNQCDINLEQIHVFLPYKLMNYEVDWCSIYDEEFPSIGEEYQLIIRCSERLSGNNRKIYNWKRKSSILQSKLEQEITDQILLLGNEPESKLLENQLRKKRDAIAIKIVNTFENEQPGELLWNSSMPIALWIRKQLPNIDNETQLNRLLEIESSSESISLSKLPELVQNIRIDASGHDPPDSHVGRHICLMWDDPNLLPPEQPLTHKKL